MAINNIILDNIQTDLITVPSGMRYAITTVIVCNTYDPNLPDAGARTDVFDLHIIKSGQALGPINMIARAIELPAGETFTFDTEKVVLDPGDKVAFVGGTAAAASTLSATVSYLEV